MADALLERPELSAVLSNSARAVDSAAVTSETDAAMAARTLNVAYLTTEYPKASHTFVRREIIALEALGHRIERFSVRDGGPVADPADIQEATKTTYLLKQPLVRHLVSCFMMTITRPLRMLNALKLVWSTWKKSDRSLVKHVAYLVEAATLCRMMEQRGVQHLHVHFGKNAVDVARLARTLGGPTYSMMIHGPGEFDAPRSFDLGGKVADSLFTTAITSYAKAQLQRWTSYEHWSKVYIVRCAISDDFLSAKRPLDEDSQQFVCIGRLTAQKGQLVLVDAVASLIREGCRLKLVLAGDGEMRQAIEQRIAFHGIPDSVEITGWIGEQRVRELLQESRAMVLPSFAEGLPVAIMEAFALGRTVISSAITGIPELVVPNKNGWLVVPGSVTDLMKAMLECLETPVPMLNAMASHGCDRVKSNHRASTEAQKLSDLLLHHIPPVVSRQC